VTFKDGITSAFSRPIVSEWKNEDDIKAELRTLTHELRRLREELRGMVTHPKPNPARPLLRRQSWPPSPDEPVAEAADSPDTRPDKPQKK
jgi:hypothetical protein